MKRPALSCLALFLAMSARADVPQPLKPVGLGLGGYSYWSAAPFANTMLSGSEWLVFSNDWGTRVFFYDTNGVLNPQFSTNGLPQYLLPGTKLRALLWPYLPNYSASAPATWPRRGNLGIGKWVVTWQGDADIRLQGATFLAGESSGPATGRLVNGRRVYSMTALNPSGHITVEDINTNTPLTDLKVWLPDPANPTQQSLETSGAFWHPTYLAMLQSLDFAFLRFMDWSAINASPQRDWADRRLPAFVFQRGILNRRSPADGFNGNRSTGIAWEYIVSLANTLNKDVWVCVPHLATDAYVTNLANLLRYGSDGVNPYTSPQANPVYPPLLPHLKIWLEFSNEIWSNGDSFPQGNWAAQQAAALGLTKEQFNARRFARIWQIFQHVFGGSERLVRVAAIWTASSSYTTPFLTELKNYGATLSPPVAPDVISPTTYFGNGIQDWAYEQANLAAGTSGQWFHTTATFVDNGVTKPVSVPLNDSYWTNALLRAQQAATFREWKRRIFSGSTAAGGGPDATGMGGGFDTSLRSTIQTIYGQPVPIVSYEGGPSLYTDYYDGPDSRDDGITHFLIALNRLPEFAEIYRIHLNMARAKGLHTHAMFVDVSQWGKYGQWGHLEYLDQPVAESAKWTAVSDWAADMAGIRHIDDVAGTRPAFATEGTLPSAVWQTPYAQDILVTNGNGPLSVTVIGSLLSPGLAFAAVPGQTNRYRLSGTPQSGGWNYLYLRVNDADGDAAWQVFSLYVAGGPGTLVESVASGPFNGASSLPWTNLLALDTNALSGWTGLNIGATYANSGGTATGTDGVGVRLHNDTNALRFSVSQGTTSESNSTLASAIADNEFWKFTITPRANQPLDLRQAEFRLRWSREEYHAPRNLSVFTSVSGFTNGQQVYTSPRVTTVNQPIETLFRLPTNAAYAAITNPIEFRIYFYGSQYAHQARLLGVKLARWLGANAPVFQADPVWRTNAAVGQAYLDNLLGAAVDPNDDVVAYAKLTGPSWLAISPSGLLTGTPGSTDAGTNWFGILAQDLSGLSTTGTLAIVVRAPLPVPQIQPPGGSYFSPLSVTLSNLVPGVSFRYTTDGSIPSSTAGHLYSGPISVSSNLTLRAVAYHPGYLDSPVASAEYVLLPPPSLEARWVGEQLQINWSTGWLQEADDLRGPWFTMTNVLPPLLLSATNEKKFFRAWIP